MIVVVRHGHFAFYPQRRGEVRRFQRALGLAIAPEGDYYTYEPLLDLPRWSQTTRPFGGVPAVVTYEGRHAWDVMRENQFVFSLALQTLVPVASIVGTVDLPTAHDYIVLPRPVLQPGVMYTLGSSRGRLVGYRGEIDLAYMRLYIDAIEEGL